MKFYGKKIEEIRNPVLDVVRALAVFSVILVHTSGVVLSKAENSDSSAYQSLSTIFAAGRFGVELFFLLSGYLLAFIYEKKLSSTKDNHRQKLFFFKARFFRIWPLWMLFSIIWGFVHFSQGRSLEWVIAGVALSSVFLLWTSPAHFDSFIGGAWSIQIEVFCYLCFYLLRGRHPKTLIFFAIAINLCGILLAFVVQLSDYGVFESLRRLTFQSGFNFFLLGWLLARIHAELIEGRQSESLQQRSATVKALGHNWLLVIFWVLSFVSAPAIFGNPIEAFGFVAMCAGVAPLFVKVRSLNLLLGYVGRRSYFIFFGHFICIEVLEEYLFEVLPSNFFLAALSVPTISLAILVLCLVVSEASFRYFEYPFMKIARTRRNAI